MVTWTWLFVQSAPPNPRCFVCWSRFGSGCCGHSCGGWPRPAQPGFWQATVCEWLHARFAARSKHQSNRLSHTCIKAPCQNRRQNKTLSYTCLRLRHTSKCVGLLFFIPTKKSNFSDFRSTFWSMLLFCMWWCGILFGTGYFFEARLDSEVRTTFWAGQEYF